MHPFALLLGLPFDEAWIVAQQMAKKIVTNEFVVMGQLKMSLIHIHHTDVPLLQHF